MTVLSLRRLSRSVYAAPSGQKTFTAVGSAGGVDGRRRR
jgi:hypothetical protein